MQTSDFTVWAGLAEHYPLLKTTVQSCPKSAHKFSHRNSQKCITFKTFSEIPAEKWLYTLHPKRVLWLLETGSDFPRKGGISSRVITCLPCSGRSHDQRGFLRREGLPLWCHRGGPFKFTQGRHQSCQVRKRNINPTVLIVQVFSIATNRPVQ